MQLGVKDVAVILNVSEKTVYRWITQGTLPAYRVHEQYRFNRAELLEWAASRRINVAPEIFHEPESAETPMPCLADALAVGGVNYRLEGHDLASVMAALVTALRLPDEVDREFLLRVLLAREALCSTAVGQGIAIPHVRSPVVLHVPRPSVALCFLEHPLDFGAMDGVPVFAIFAVLSPTLRAHLHLMARLGFLFQDAPFQAMLRAPGKREEILSAVRRVEQKLVQTRGGPEVEA